MRQRFVKKENTKEVFWTDVLNILRITYRYCNAKFGNFDGVRRLSRRNEKANALNLEKYM